MADQASACAGRRAGGGAGHVGDAARAGTGGGTVWAGRATARRWPFSSNPCQLAVDAEDEAVPGLVDGAIWTRDGWRQGGPAPASFRGQARVAALSTLDGARAASARLGTARQVIVVGDRESDIYPAFARRPDDVELIARVAQNRSLASGHLERVFDAALAWRTASWRWRSGPSRARRRARRHAVGFGAEASDGSAPGRATAPSARIRKVSPSIVVRDRGDRAARGRQAAALAALYQPARGQPSRRRPTMVRLYRAALAHRGRYSRVLKSDGHRHLEDTQVEAAERLFKLAALGLGADDPHDPPLTDARDGSRRPATDVVDGALIAPIAAIGKTLEGNTARQKNHHPEGWRAWLAWITARLGGSNCYVQTTRDQRPWQRDGNSSPPGSKAHLMAQDVMIKPIGRCVNPVALGAERVGVRWGNGPVQSNWIMLKAGVTAERGAHRSAHVEPVGALNIQNKKRCLAWPRAGAACWCEIRPRVSMDLGCRIRRETAAI